MPSFTFSVEQVRSAPPEVRRWIEREIAASLAAMNKSEHDASRVNAASLAACMPEEAMQLFELIKGNFLLAQVFFELARETPNSHGAAPLCPISIADILRHTRLRDGDRLVDCLPLSIGRFSRSATIPKRRYSDSINMVMSSFTKPPMTAFARSGNSCSPSTLRSQADRSRERDQCRRDFHRLIWGRARISRSTRRAPPP
jgi:hypothetical protein